jgi:hypothetical protein
MGYARQVTKRTALSLTAIAYVNLVDAGEGHLKAIKHAANACTPIAGLAIARSELGYWPTQTEYAAHWKISERKAQLEWAAFRRAFPGEQTPERFAKLLYADAGPKIERSVVLTSPAPPELQPTA